MTTHNNYYCDICEKEVVTEVREVTEDFEVRDEVIRATIKIRVCKECGEEVWDKELEQKNEKIIFSAYRRKKGLLMPEEIKAIREKYHLPQSLFSLLLGFGEKTITRYERGSIQDAAHDLLIRLMNEERNIKATYQAHKDLFNEKDQEKIEKALYKGVIIIPFFQSSNENKQYRGDLNLA